MSPIKILILSFYYKPDLCAGSFRCTALVAQLSQYPDIQIEVITTYPNRYASFATAAPEYETHKNITIRRIKLPSHKSGMIDQIKAFFKFYRKAQKEVKNTSYDMVFSTSSRLFTAFLAARIAKQKKIPLYLDIRDIFVDTLQDILPKKISFFAKPLLSMIEKYTFRTAKRINLVSKGFEAYFKQYVHCDYRCYTNGIDEEFIDTIQVESTQKRETLTVLYAGNIGEGQGLHFIIPALAKSLDPKVHFRILGDGGRKSALIDSVRDCPNVTICPPVERMTLQQEYSNADILFLHLNDYPAFEKVLPSKIFEYAASGKPIWAGVSGYAAEFLSEEVQNTALFYPCNLKEALIAFDMLGLNSTDRSIFIEKYARKKIMSDMAVDIVDFAKKGKS